MALKVLRAGIFVTISLQAEHQEYVESGALGF